MRGARRAVVLGVGRHAASAHGVGAGAGCGGVHAAAARHLRRAAAAARRAAAHGALRRRHVPSAPISALRE